MRKVLIALASLCLFTQCQEPSKDDRPANNREVVKVKEETPAFLFKIVSVEDWGNSCKTVHTSTMDQEFIHLATIEQLDRIVSKFWGNENEYVVLKLETTKLLGDLVFEANPGGSNKYYHLYSGSIPLGAIREMKVHQK